MHLKNVEVRNFLYDYEALVYVEKDNFLVSKHPGDAPGQRVLHFGNSKVDANIVIEDSRFIDSAFTLGMIYVPPGQRFVDPETDILFEYELNQKPTFSGAISELESRAKEQK